MVALKADYPTPSLFDLDPEPPDHPTATRPGTEDRIRVYIARAARGYALHHPRDVKLRPTPGEWARMLAERDHRDAAAGPDDEEDEVDTEVFND